MGALHAGHISLIRRCKAENNICISSIFVNPTQFNNQEDFDKYPITIEKDIDMLEEAGCDILFLPSATEIYPDGYRAPVYELGYLETILEGHYRPGHFQGVCQVVDLLLGMTSPDRLYLGRKDYQQCMVISRLVDLTGRHTSIVICDTLREEDGLAMSSRNMRLSPDERRQALAIYHILCSLRDQLRPGECHTLKQNATRYLEEQGFRVDYVAICRADNLQPIENWDGQAAVVGLVAAFIGQVRLIDNMALFPR